MSKQQKLKLEMNIWNILYLNYIYPTFELRRKIYMLFAGWKVRGHSFPLYRPTLSRQITYLFFSKLSNEKKLTEKNSRKRYYDRDQR